MNKTFSLRFAVLLLLLGSWLASPAQAADAMSPQALHAPWDELLHKYVTPDGMVDYQGLLDDEDKLLDYLMAMRKTAPNEQTWTPADIQAFWINVYNASTVYMVLQYYPVSSINDIRMKGRSYSPWEFAGVTVGGQEYSLNQIEREKLSARFHDPRIHFALVQGASSGPRLLNEAYNGAHLQQQLEQQTRSFINDPARNMLGSQQASISGLFSFYAAEFGEQTQVLEFLNRYARVPLAAATPISYLPFSWNLNDRRTQAEIQALRK
ncbi:DUF547 domain-containing protein [Hymenobacter sediminicola]|uniref:DUF547 domain-containing protein n=1 Tax=Hymenobacter sediminicola TaxID=2761579 RepID=A0A7G7W4P4_9BACT|nr:DUF547 domain-containing protein [Hymenobacter sediminicola]QNH61337.1 DUF547 domain-containing protein [Hymenobacter sediminicola]